MPIENETNPAVVRHTARLKLFEAVYRDRPLERALDHYISNEETIVSGSIRRWAERVKTDPADAVRDEAITLFQRDKAIAEKFKQGVEINGRRVGLPGLIKREQTAVKKLQGK